MNKWDYPQTINPIVAAFPANVTGTLLPPAEDVPTEFFDSDNKWAVFTSQLFGRGWDGRNPSLVMKDGVDASLAFEHFQTVLNTGWYEFTPQLGAPVGFIYGDWDDRYPTVYLSQTEFALLNDLRGLVVKTVERRQQAEAAAVRT